MDLLFVAHIPDSSVLPVPPVRGDGPRGLLHHLVKGLRDLEVGVISPSVSALGKPPASGAGNVSYYHVMVNESCPIQFRGKTGSVVRRWRPNRMENRYLREAAKVIFGAGQR